MQELVFDSPAPGVVIDNDVLRSMWLASLAYACGWKRAGRHYLLDAEILMAPPAEESDEETLASE